MRLSRFVNSLAVMLMLSAFFSSSTQAATVHNGNGWTLNVDGRTGDYVITTQSPKWSIGGTIGHPLTDVGTAQGVDGIGAYQLVNFAWQDSGRRSGSIRLYDEKPLALFSVKYEDAVKRSPPPFPILSTLPSNLLAFRYSERAHLIPERFDLRGGEPDEQYGGPIALFDAQANAMIVSPASNFMIAMMSGDLQHGIRSGLNRTLTGVPAGYEQQTVLAVSPGINKTWDIWGRGLTSLYHKTRPANDADVGLKYLGFWTDNGSDYYYNYDVKKGYANTLLAVKDYLATQQIPIHYMQLDSWWYPKTFDNFEKQTPNKPRSKNPSLPAGTWNRYGGMLEFVGDKDLFPSGLSAFQKQLGLPLVVHNRWIDPTSPYHADYKISGVAAVDPKWWNTITADIARGGAITYEQDWNSWVYFHSPALSGTPWAGDAYLDGMAAACAAHHLTMQYCMVLPRILLQGGAEYPNLTTVRVSDDRLDRGKWHAFLYGSTMAGALGVWPWTDVYKSSEMPNMLIATLSGGMVGLSDKIGDEAPANIFQAVRKDGVIVKPDAPLVPTDASFIAEAEGNSTAPLICSAHSSTGDSVAYYIFACTRQTKYAPPTPWTLDPTSLGITGPAVAYDYLDGSTQRIDSAHPMTGTLGAYRDWAYSIVVPIGPSGTAFIGDIGKFATRGRQRIATCSDDGHALHATVTFAAGETSVTLAVYCPALPNVRCNNGRLGAVVFDGSRKLAQIQILPDTVRTDLSSKVDVEIR